MIAYLIKFSACLLIFIVFYKFFLEKESVHRFKRFYLLGTLFLSIGIPLITFTYYVEPSVEIIPQITQNITLQGSAVLLKAQTNYLPIILWSIYGLGALLFGIKFTQNLHKLNYKIKHNPKRRNKLITNVLLKDLIVPHTFFRFVFLNKEKFETQQIPKEVFWHEEAHAKQIHSIDVLFLEVLQILLWFNPLIYVTKYFIKLNHEFLADQSVLNKGVETTTYQKILLAFSTSNSYRNTLQPQLASAINYSSIKKRFTVMKTQTSKKRIWFRSLLLLPLLAILLYSFSEREQIVKNIEPLMTNQATQAKTDKASEEMMVEYNSFIIEFITTHKLDMSRYRRIVAIYDLMSQKQKASVEPYPVIPSLNLSKTKPIIPTKKNERQKINLIVNGENIYLNNQKINLEDFATAFDIITEKWSEKDFNLYHLDIKIKNTSDIFIDKINNEFRKTYLSKRSKSENNYIISNDKITPPLPPSVYNNIPSPSEPLKHINAMEQREASFKYKGKIITAKEASNLIIKNKDLKIKTTLNDPKPPIVHLINSKKLVLQQKATKKQIAEYNRLAKHYNAQPKNKLIIKQKDVERLKYLYNLMSKKQKKNAEPFPNIPPPPPPAPNAPKIIEVKDSKIAAKLKYAEEKNRMQQEKLAYKETQIAAKSKSKSEMIAAKLKYVEERKQLQKEKLAYKEASIKAQNDKLIQVKESRSVEKSEIKQAEIAAKLKYVEDRKQLQKEKLVYKEASLKKKQDKIKAKKEVKKALLEARKKEKELKKKSKTGSIKIKGETLYYIELNNKREYFNRWGNLVDKDGVIISSKQTKF